jgi:hypothetical protein
MAPLTPEELYVRERRVKRFWTVTVVVIAVVGVLMFLDLFFLR